MVTYLVGKHYQLYLHLADLTEQQLGQDRIERLKGLSLDASLKDKQDWDELAIALGGSWQEKRGELLQKRTRVLLAILLLITLPVSIEELADTLGYKKKESLRGATLIHSEIINLSNTR